VTRLNQAQPESPESGTPGSDSTRPGNAHENPDALGDLIPSNQRFDPAAGKLAERIGGKPQVEFTKNPGREFDAVSDRYVAQSKPANFQLGSNFRDQAKATFQAAKDTSRQPYFHFEGPPTPAVISKLLEYGRRYGIDPVIDTKPFNK
jgi:hypothetical protein